MGMTSPFRDYFEGAGFSSREIAEGVALPAVSAAPELEYRAVRDGIAMTDLGGIHIYEVAGAEAMDYLDFLLTGPVARLREEHVLHTLLVDEGGDIVGDVYVVNIDGERYFMLTDGARRADVDRLMEAHRGDYKATVRNLDGELAAFSVDGPYAWMPAKAVFGPEILGLRYMGYLAADADGCAAHVLRAGKTGEYGYWVLAPRHVAGALFGRVLAAAKEAEGLPVSLYGTETARVARMENHFFDMDVEGKHSRNPYEIGLFWTIHPNKEMMATESLETRQKATMKRRVVGFTVSGNAKVAENDPVLCDGNAIGTVVGQCHSDATRCQIGLALVDIDYCYSGMTYECRERGLEIKTISMPFLKNKSLGVKMV